MTPTVYIYGVLIRTFVMTGDLNKAELWLHKMMTEADLRPDRQAVSSVFEAFARNGDVNKAINLLRRMSRTSNSPWGMIEDGALPAGGVRHFIEAFAKESKPETVERFVSAVLSQDG